MIEQLREYFKNTPREQVLKDWEKTKEHDNVGVTIDKFFMNYIPKRGDIFKWCDEQYLCLDSSSYSGTVCYMDAENPYTIRHFVWCYGREDQEFVRTASDEELEKYINI